MIKTHVFINWDPVYFLKQSPGMSSRLDGVEFSFGLNVPDDIDVLIVHTRSSYSIPTHLPRERTVFVAGEPDVIHPFSKAFLNQFGLVLTTSPVELETEVLRENYCLHWFAGVDFDAGLHPDHLKGYDWFKNLTVPEKTTDKISIITSTRYNTEHHKIRSRFIDHVEKHHGDVVEVFGRGRNEIGDKLEALLGYKYHIALENGDEPYTWTEKLSDPLLAWTFPFYSGCSNAALELPRGSFMPIDISRPEEAMREMLSAVEEKRWEQSISDIGKARNLVLERFNIMFALVRLSKLAMAKSPHAQKSKRWRIIRSEKSLPMPRGKPTSSLKRFARYAPVAIFPKFDIKIARLREFLVRSRSRLKSRMNAGR